MVRKGQTESIDVLIAAGIFSFTVLTLFYVLFLAGQAERINAIKVEGGRLPYLLNQNVSEAGFVGGGTVDEAKLLELTNLTYDELRAILGVAGHDFCIHLQDETGNLINITVAPGASKAGIGSQRANISGFICG